MGWKSTMDISRKEAERLIMTEMITLSDKTDKEVEEMLEEYGFGDDSKLPHYGYNFNIVD